MHFRLADKAQHLVPLRYWNFKFVYYLKFFCHECAKAQKFTKKKKLEIHNEGLPTSLKMLKTTSKAAACGPFINPNISSAIHTRIY